MRKLLALLVVSSLAVPAHADSLEPAHVVGGVPVPKGKWRDVVAVVAGDVVCTGTLVAPDVVLTAGHCISEGPMEVIADAIDLGAPFSGDRIAVKWARAYPDWHQRYDIGVLMLEHVARGPARRVAAACTTRALLEVGTPLQIVGFGLTTADGSGTNTVLREATVPVIDPTCTSDLACEPAIAPHGELVAGGQGADSCFGDSGGPAYLDTPDGPALVGVVSRGLAIPGAPCGQGGIYVRADKVVAWVQNVTGARLARTACPGRADEEEPVVAAEPGGCTAGGGSPGLVVLAGSGLGGLWRRRARHRRTDRVRT